MTDTQVPDSALVQVTSEEALLVVLMYKALRDGAEPNHPGVLTLGNLIVRLAKAFHIQTDLV